MIIIGEKINASRSEVKEIIRSRDEDGLARLAREQAEAGAHYIDVNVGTGTGSGKDEADAMEWAVKTVAAAVDKPVCVDSADPQVLEAGLKALGDTDKLINSAKAEDDSLDVVVRLAADYACPVVALAMDETGIPMEAEGRIAACRKIAAACERFSVPLSNVFFDPLVLPVGTDVRQGLVTLETIEQIKQSFEGAKTVVGLSNISFGLPARARLNSAFLSMAAYAGLDAAIADPLDEELMAAVKTANVLLGKDKHCRKYTRAFRN